MALPGPDAPEPRVAAGSGTIRVLHVVNSLDAGGMERVLIRVASELQPRGFDISVCGLQRRGVLADSFPSPERVLSLNKPPGRSFAAIWRLYRLIRQVRPDVVHTHNIGPLVYAVAATAYGRVCPILHGEHCQLHGPNVEPPRLRLRRVLYPACQGIHTVSEELRRELLGLGAPADRLVAVVNGVDTVAYAPGDRNAARSHVGIPETALVLAVSARLVRRKRLDLVIRAVAVLAARGADVHLLVAGDGPLRSDLEAFAQASGAGARIHFLGFHADVRPVYQAADLLVLASTGEGLSNAILEAMACGVPVLCHDACGCAEVVEDGADGWVRRIESAEALAAQLAHILDDVPALRACGTAARAKMVERFDIRRTAAGYERLYQNMAGHAR